MLLVVREGLELSGVHVCVPLRLRLRLRLWMRLRLMVIRRLSH